MDDQGVKDVDMEKMMAIAAELARPETSHSNKAKGVSLVVPPTPPAKGEVRTFASRPNPLRINPVEEPRPMTSSSRRLSFASVSTSKRPIKYGTGKYARVELVPQPSDDVEDPLNWPTWKKELNFGALLLVAALVGVLKTAFVSVNSELAVGYSVSYTAAAALTAVPLMLSALTGLASLVAARVWGKRPVYLASMAVLFIGAAWSIRVGDSYAQCMAARVFQGLGWGAFDVLVAGSIQDTFFEHELGLHLGAYYTVVAATTWGGPVIGGAVSASAMGFELQFEIITVFLVVALLLLALGAPETVFDRSFYLINTPASAWSLKKLPLRPRGPVTMEMAWSYAKKMKPYSYDGPIVDLRLLLQAPRALVAPTTVLLVVGSLVPFCALWGISASLSLLFSPLPFNMSSGPVGLVMTAPWLLSTATVAAFALVPLWHRKFVPLFNVGALAAGTTLVFVGLLAFGLYVEACMTTGAPASGSSAFALGGVGSRLSFPAVSLVVGLLAAGAYTLDATVRPLVRRSAQFTSSNMAIALRNTADMNAGVVIWRALLAGFFVLGLPNAVWFWDGLKTASVGMATAQVFIATALGLVWWYYDEHIRRLDGRVMGCVDMRMLKRAGSFFDMD